MSVADIPSQPCTGAFARKKPAHHGTADDILFPSWHSLISRVVQHDVEEDVKAAKHARDSAVPLDIDEEPAVHELLHCNEQ